MLTTDQEAEVTTYINANSNPDKDFAKIINNYKDCRKSKSQLLEITAFASKVRLGQIKSRQRTGNSYEETIATVGEVSHIMRLDRDWDEEWFIGILDHTYSPLYRFKYSDAIGVEDAN